MITFILGGAKSGKTDFALKLAKKFPQKRIYIATALPIDKEMNKKISIHKKERGNDFETIEEPINIHTVFDKITKKDVNVIIVDCITIWINNLMFYNKEPKIYINKFITMYMNNFKHIPLFIVSNEVGMGLVPENGISRTYREFLGNANKLFADKADEVYFMVAAIPWRIK